MKMVDRDRVNEAIGIFNNILTRSNVYGAPDMSWGGTTWTRRYDLDAGIDFIVDQLQGSGN